jgi:hypothetical protein
LADVDKIYPAVCPDLAAPQRSVYEAGVEHALLHGEVDMLAIYKVFDLRVPLCGRLLYADDPPVLHPLFVERRMRVEVYHNSPTAPAALQRRVFQDLRNFRSSFFILMRVKVQHDDIVSLHPGYDIGVGVAVGAGQGFQRLLCEAVAFLQGQYIGVLLPAFPRRFRQSLRL